MAKNSVADWSTTAASNTDVGGIDINEGCPAANINNGIREVMAQVKTYSGTIPALASANTFTGVNTYTKIQKWAKGADVASASTLTLGDDGNYFDITGTTTITSIATKGVGTVVLLQFDGALILTHNATDLILPGGANITTAAGDHAEFVEYATGDWRCTNYTRAANLETYGQCRLTLSGGNLLLSRLNGRLLTINGVHYQIPSSGPTLAATSLTPSTLYYIYAYMNSGTMTLEASTTGHATDSTTGVEIKSGDATRTLVGMARPITGPNWADSITQRFVRSWFNRDREAMRKAFTAIRSTTSTSLTEVNSEIRCEWLQWADEIPTAHIQGTAVNGSASVYTNTAIGWDGTADANTLNSITSATGLAYNCSTSAPKEGLSEGYHYATLMGSVSSASTGSWTSGVSGVFTSLSVSIG